MTAATVASDLRLNNKTNSQLKKRKRRARQILTVYSGLMGSGKTTAARKLKQQNVTAWLLGRDDIRTAIFRQADQIAAEEEIVTDILLHLARLGLCMGYDIIVDDINIFPEEKRRWNALADELGVKMRWQYMMTDIDECIRRDAQRPSPVGQALIHEYAAAAGLEARGSNKHAM